MPATPCCVQVAQRLKSKLREEDVLARLGGDEFAVIQTGCPDQRVAATDLAQRITKLIAEPFQLSGHRVEIGTSIGISLAPEHGHDQEHLLKKADLALYRSKSAGRNCYTVYDVAMSAELEARNTLEGDLRDAIAQCQFEVHYQPFYESRPASAAGGSAGALAPSEQGAGPARPVHPARRRDRADRAAWRVDRRPGLQ